MTNGQVDLVVKLLETEREFVREVEYCRQPWGSRLERFTEIEWVLQDAVDEVMVNQKPMRETMTAYASRIDATLANIRSNEKFEFRPIREHSEILRFLLGIALVLLCAASALYLRTARRHRKHTAVAFSFLAPSLLHLTVFVFTPIVFSAYLSTHRWDIVVAEKPFVGTQNFGEMLADPSIWGALRNTLLYTLNVPLGMTVSLCVALLLNRRLAGLGFLRTLYFLPSVTSFVAIALVWIWIYHPTFGVANYVLSIAGLPPLQWLNSSQTAMLSIIIFSVWLGVGYQMVIFLAGLQGIPEELYEAARIDGAGRWRLFRSITWPLLRPTTFCILVTSMIASFQVFTSVYIMTTGGPVGSTDVIVYHSYQAAWEQLRMGYASAMSWVLFVIVMIATWRGAPRDRILNPQMIIDWPVMAGDRGKTYLTIPVPVLQRLVDGRASGIALTPLGAINASFYAREAAGGQLSARLLFDLQEGHRPGGEGSKLHRGEE